MVCSLDEEISQLKGKKDQQAVEDRNDTEWIKRLAQYVVCWDGKRPWVFKKFVEFQFMAPGLCQNCCLESACVRCISCRMHLCGKCDFAAHTKMVFHDRLYFHAGSIYTLAPNQFLSSEKELYITGKCYFFHHLFPPHTSYTDGLLCFTEVSPCLFTSPCVSCKLDTVSCVPGEKKAIVVTVIGT